MPVKEESRREQTVQPPRWLAFGDPPTDKIQCCIARCIRPIVIADECVVKLPCHLITTKDFSDVRSCCSQLHNPIFAPFGVNGANSCE